MNSVAAESNIDSHEQGFLMVRHDRIVRFKQQPRTFFSGESIAELAESIKERGQNTPVQLCKSSGGKKHPPLLDAAGNVVFTLIDGERRWRACTKLAKEAGKPFLMKATVEVIDDIETHFERSFGANFGTEEMTALDIAAGLARLRKNGATHEQLAKRYSRSIKYVIDYLSLNNLHSDVREMMDPSVPKDQRLGVTHAVQIARIKNDDMQKKLAAEALELGLSVQDIRMSVDSTGLTDLSYIGTSGWNGSSYQPRRRVSDERAIFTNMLTSVRKKLTPFADRIVSDDLDLEAMYDSCFDGDEVFDTYLKTLEEISDFVNVIKNAASKARHS